MARKIIVAILILLSFLLQSTVFHAISFGGIIPNLMIILTSSYGLMRGERAGLVVGFFCGLLNDIFFGQFIGIYALLYMYIGFLSGKFSRIFFPQDIKLPIALILGSDLVYGIVSYGLFFLIRAKFHFGYYLLNVIIPEMVYTILVTLFVYPLLLFIHQKLAAIEKRSEKKFVS